MLFSSNYLLRKIKSFTAVYFNWPEIYTRRSYSQEGEDLILTKLFESQKGLYVDVGAHHPFRYSNTYLLYKRGWKGINIDPTPGVKALFDLSRPKDINISAAIGMNSKKAILNIYDDSAFNTINENIAGKLKIHPRVRLKTKTTVNVLKLSSILKKHHISYIDLLNVDTEGSDYEVIESIDWKHTKIKVIAIENASPNIKINRFLKNKGFNLYSNTSLTNIYLSK